MDKRFKLCKTNEFNGMEDFDNIVKIMYKKVVNVSRVL